VKTRALQEGGVLIISLIILLVMTLLGVSAMTGSDLQERMVGNQKRMIQASMAAESGAILALQWLRTHPEAWGDAKAWQAGDEALPSKPSASPNFGNAVFWIESIHFEGDTAVIVSRGGISVADRIMGESVVQVTLQNKSDEIAALAGDAELRVESVAVDDEHPASDGISTGSAVPMREATPPIVGRGSTTHDQAADVVPAYDRAPVDGAFDEGSRVSTVLDAQPRTKDKEKRKILAWKPLVSGMSSSGSQDPQ